MPHTVKPGDTFSSIAKRYGVTLNELSKANPQVKNVGRIYPGQVINLPSNARSAVGVNDSSNLLRKFDQSEILRKYNQDELLKKSQILTSDSTASNKSIAFGKKVSAEFKKKVIDIATRLGIGADELMAVMAFESGETFSPSIPNSAGSGAVGLIQFMPTTATGLGTSTEELKKLTAEKQLDYVEKYFAPYKNKLSTLEDIYMVVLYPAAVGKPNDYVLFDKSSDKAWIKKAYTQNKGLDSDKDGKITKAEAAAMVRAKLQKGLKADFKG